MLHDALMLNPDQCRFTSDGPVFTRHWEDGGSKKVFTADGRFDDAAKPEEGWLKEFVVWCYDRRMTPVRI
jgi:hypothetical protein